MRRRDWITCGTIPSRLTFPASIPQPFDPDLILLNMVTVADATGVVIVTGCKNLYKLGGRATLGPARDLVCPTSAKAAFERKGQFLELSSLARAPPSRA